MAQIPFRMSAECMVNSLAGFTSDVFGRLPSTQSCSCIVRTSSPSVICDVIATRTTSCIWSLNASGETTSAGRLFDELRSVKGKGTRTMLPAYSVS
jgi:hypothetical protein